MPSQEDKIKSLKIDSKTSNKDSDLAKFKPLVEMIARKELQTKSKTIISFDELINTGLIVINKLIDGAKVNAGTEYNSSYIAQSVKWAMKDEIRSRQGWYGVKSVVSLDQRGEGEEGSFNSNSQADPTETTEIKNFDDARKAVFEVIMSVEGMEEDLGFSPADPNGVNELERLELLSMKNSLKKSIGKLPKNLKEVIEMRYYDCLTGNEVAEKLGVTPSRISHMINEAVKKLRVSMIAEGYGD